MVNAVGFEPTTPAGYTGSEMAVQPLPDLAFGVPLGSARHLRRLPRVFANASDLDHVLRQSAAMVAEAVRADSVTIRLGGPGGLEVSHVRATRVARPTAEPATLMVPLVLRGRRLGQMAATRASGRPFPATATTLMNAFAAPISVAIDNARLYQALQDRLRDVTRLAEASEALAQLGPLDQVGKQISLHAARLLGAGQAALVTLLNGSSTPGELFAHQLAATPTFEPVLRSTGLVAGRALISNDIAADRRADVRSLATAFRGSLVAVVARAGDRPVALLIVADKPRGLFTQQDAKLLSVFAAQAAVAIENASLYDAAVREREQLKELEQLKSQFLSLVSHELRTPLASIKASAEVLQSTAPPDALDAHVKLVRNIVRSSDRLNALITDLLDLARMEGGRLELDLEPLDLRQVADDAVATVRPLADEWRQKIRVCKAESPCLVAGDRRRLEQIVMNLLSNAIKYAPNGSNIWVTVGPGEGDDALVTVRDEGPGIPPTEHRRVFERFYRLDAEHTKRATGTGLGLPIAKALAELHGGSINVDSDERGSTFALAVPVVAQR
jgi:signal transduction histidine kinase